MPERLRIGICGFGVAGGALAILLGRAGHDVMLLERAPNVGPVGAGFLLQPSGQRVLASMDLLDAVAAKSARIERIEAHTSSGRQLTNLRYGAVTNGGCAYGVHRGVLFETLHEAVIAAGVRIVLGVDVTAVEESTASSTVCDASKRTHGPFDLLIGADGSRSVLRHILNPRARRREYEYGALWGCGRSAWPIDVLHQVAHGTRRLIGLLPLGEGRCTFFWGLRRDELEAVRARGFEAFCAEAAALFPAVAEVLQDLGSFDRLTFAGYLHSLPHRVHSSRMVLAGDAAHAMSPHLGQGANLALLDAECLARHLSALPVESAVAAYAAERRGQSRYFSLLSRWLSPTFQSDSTFLGWARDVALPVMGAVPPVRRQMELSVAGVKRGVFDRLWG